MHGHDADEKMVSYPVMAWRGTHGSTRLPGGANFAFLKLLRILMLSITGLQAIN
jgi:hypothetical protein